MNGAAAPITATSSPIANITGARASAAILRKWFIAGGGNSTGTERLACAAMAAGSSSENLKKPLKWRFFHPLRTTAASFG
jgi:hypothetical protein